MRLGTAIGPYSTPEQWIALHVREGYGAAYCPVTQADSEETVLAYRRAAESHNLVIAEVGVWNNLLDADPSRRKANFEYSIGQMRLADKLGARCCVNISGSLSDTWDGPHPMNLTPATFDRVVEITQALIDESGIQHTYYTLEPMPWMYPCDVESSLKLIEAVNRSQFAVHVDLCNLVNSYEKFCHTGDLVRSYFAALAPHIRSIHAKDIVIGKQLTLHLDEAIPGEGAFDFDALLIEAAKLDDIPIMAEHLSTQEQYRKATSYLRSRAQALNLPLDTAT